MHHFSSKLKQTPISAEIITNTIIHVEGEYKKCSLQKEIYESMNYNCKKLLKIKLPQIPLKLPKNLLIQIYPQLIQLNLSGNRIGDNIELKLPKIRMLNLSRNELKSLKLQRLMPNLTILNINQNRFQKIPVLKAPKLAKLYLSHNCIQNIEELSSQIVYPYLQTLTLNDNLLKGNFSSINCPKLQQLEITVNFPYSYFSYVKNFLQKQYLNMKTLIIEYVVTQLQLPNAQLPQLLMPKLQTLIISKGYFTDIKAFSNGIYPCLKTLEITRNQSPLILHQLKAPNLKNINFQKTKIINFLQFLKGDYKDLEIFYLKDNNPQFYKSLPKLKNKIIKDNKFNLEINPQQQSLNQISYYQIGPGRENEQKIIKIKLHYSFYKNLQNPFTWYMKFLKLNLTVINSIQILFHIDIKCVQQIQIIGNHFLPSTYKKLAKLNFHDTYLDNLKVLAIDQYQKSNIITFFKKVQQQRYCSSEYEEYIYKKYGQIEIVRTEYWKRMIPFSCCKDGRFIKQMKNFRQIGSRLLSLKYKEIRKHG